MSLVVHRSHTKKKQKFILITVWPSIFQILSLQISTYNQKHQCDSLHSFAFLVMRSLNSGMYFTIPILDSHVCSIAMCGQWLPCQTMQVCAWLLIMAAQGKPYLWHLRKAIHRLPLDYPYLMNVGWGWGPVCLERPSMCNKPREPEF